MMTFLLVGACMVSVGLWFYTLLDMAKRHFIDPYKRSVWLMIVLFFPLIGCLFYLKMRKQLTTSESRKFQPKFKKQ